MPLAADEMAFDRHVILLELRNQIARLAHVRHPVVLAVCDEDEDLQPVDMVQR